MPISGYTAWGKSLRGNYIFSDDDGDLEAGSTYKWYRSDVQSEIGVEISGATEQTYIIEQTIDEGKYIRFEVTPIDSFGTIGESLLSEPVYIP